MDFQSGHACFALIVQAWGASVATFANNAAVDGQVVARLHHVANVVFSWRTIGADGSGAAMVSVHFTNPKIAKAYAPGACSA